MLEQLYNHPVRLELAGVLSTVFFDNGHVFMNTWSLVHFISGMCIMYILIKGFDMKKNLLQILMLILVVYELIEFALYFNLAPNWFFDESIRDVLSDLFFGMLGGFIVWCKVRK